MIAPKKTTAFFSAPESHGAAAQTAPGATNVGTGLRPSDVDQPDLGPSATTMNLLVLSRERMILDDSG